jgi:hypothetical protein
LILLAVNIFVTLKSLNLQQSKACPNMPIKFAAEYPDCANRLLEAMNITNVKVVPAGTIESRRYKESILLYQIQLNRAD